MVFVLASGSTKSNIPYVALSEYLLIGSNLKAVGDPEGATEGKKEVDGENDIEGCGDDNDDTEGCNDVEGLDEGSDDTDGEFVGLSLGAADSYDKYRFCDSQSTSRRFVKFLQSI